MDSTLALDMQVISVVKAGFSQLRIISKLKPILSFKDMETVIHAFVSSHIDFCNSLYISLGQLSRLAVARLVTHTKKRESITPVLVTLHWLPVKFRIEFKVLLLERSMAFILNML